MSMNNLALVLGDLGRYNEAEQMHRQAFELREKVLGREHPDTLTSMDNLAWTLRSLGRYDKAEQMHRQAFELREKVLGPKHPHTLASMNNMVSVQVARPGVSRHTHEHEPPRISAREPRDITDLAARTRTQLGEGGFRQKVLSVMGHAKVLSKRRKATNK